MEKKINEIYPWCPNTDLNGEFVLCLDRNTNSGEFAFELLLCSQLSCGANVILLLFNHLSAHYESVLQKQGLNANKLIAEGKLTLISMDHSQSSCMTFQEFVVHVSKVILKKKQLNPNTSVGIYIDDILCMELMGTNDDCRRFMMQLNRQLRLKDVDTLAVYSKAYSENNCSIVETGVKRVNPYDVDASKIENCYCGARTSHSITGCSSSVCNCVDIECPLYAYCSYQCTMCILISPLQSGYALDVHGQIQITRANQLGSSGFGTTLIYKAIDTGVTCSVCM